MKKITNITTVDRYLDQIGDTSEIVAVWEQGSYLEGISDKYSDRDFIVVWKKDFPSVEIRFKIAKEMKCDVHEIKDVASIKTGFDLFSDKEFLFNFSHANENTTTEKYQKLNSGRITSHIEGILMSVSGVKDGKIFFQKDNWADDLKKKTSLDENRRRELVNYFKKKLSISLALLEKSKDRKDFIQFIVYLKEVLRSFQLIYLLKNHQSIISEKHFEKRFVKIENGPITKLIRNITNTIPMDEIYQDTNELVSEMGIKKSKKFTA